MPPKKSPACRALGGAIRAARSQQGYSQEAFALKIGLDRSYYGAIERGEFNVTLDTITKIAAGLRVPAWELLKRADSNNATGAAAIERLLGGLEEPTDDLTSPLDGSPGERVGWEGSE